MQKCRNCSNQFLWKDIAKSLWGSWGYAPIECKKCGTKHFVKWRTRLLVSISTSIPLLLFLYLVSNHLIAPFRDYVIPVYIGWFILGMLWIPFFARYHIKE